MVLLLILSQNSHGSRHVPATSIFNCVSLHPTTVKVWLMRFGGTGKHVTHDFCYVPGNRVTHQTGLASQVKRKMLDTWVMNASFGAIRNNSAKSPTTHSLTDDNIVVPQSTPNWKVRVRRIITVAYEDVFDLAEVLDDKE